MVGRFWGERGNAHVDVMKGEALYFSLDNPSTWYKGEHVSSVTTDSGRLLEHIQERARRQMGFKSQDKITESN